MLLATGDRRELESLHHPFENWQGLRTAGIAEELNCHR